MYILKRWNSKDTLFNCSQCMFFFGLLPPMRKQLPLRSQKIRLLKLHSLPQTLTWMCKPPHPEIVQRFPGGT